MMTLKSSMKKDKYYVLSEHKSYSIPSYTIFDSETDAIKYAKRIKRWKDKKNVRVVKNYSFNRF